MFYDLVFILNLRILSAPRIFFKFGIIRENVPESTGWFGSENPVDHTVDIVH